MKHIVTTLAALALSTAYAQDAAAAATTAAEPDVLPLWEMIVFCVVVVGVIGLGIWKSGGSDSEQAEGEKGAESYFLAGRGLSWWLVGFSLIAANISTEQFVGMSGKAANWVGLAIAGYEWLAAIVLVIVAFTFLPMLLKRGVYTIPQFLEERYNGAARTIMAVANLIILVGVPTAGVIFAGAKVVSGYFDLNMTIGCAIIGFCATFYVFIGGLKACAWTDLIWGAALIIGGGVVAYFAIDAIGAADPNVLIKTASATSGATVDSLANASGLERFFALNTGDAITAANSVGGKLHMIRPADDPEIPWTALCLGLWIPNFFYWGLNQYIMQRTLASKSLAEGQLGVVFAAGLKLLIPFVVLIPGILAYNLYNEDMRTSAKQKTEAIINSAVKTGKTPLYNVTADYLMTEPAEALDFLNRNTGNVSAELVEEKAPKLAAQISGFTSAAAATDEAQLLSIAQQNELSVPESAQSLDNKKTVVCALLADKIANGNKQLIKALKDNSNYAATDALTGYDYDSAFGTLLRRLLPGTGWAWFVLAALFGAVVSSLASMLNSASTLFTMDIYNKLRGESTSQRELVMVGKGAVLLFAIIALLLAIFLSNKLDSIFSYIQEFQGFLSPGALAVFIFGFFVPKCPRYFGWLGIAISVVEYGLLLFICPDMAFLNRMAVCLITISLVGVILTLVNHLGGGEAVVLQNKGIIEMQSSSRAKKAGVVVIALTIALYILFW
ncbi:MAG: sodium/solute symporter [Akkermansiaceae bacterium]|nr:sodium/solute symporter [Akkermansiaceae bacterium]